MKRYFIELEVEVADEPTSVNSQYLIGDAIEAVDNYDAVTVRRASITREGEAPTTIGGMPIITDDRIPPGHFVYLEDGKPIAATYTGALFQSGEPT